MYKSYFLQNTTVAQLKEKIAIRTGIKAENQQLIYINKYMQDTHTLAHYETLGNESNIFLVMRLLGGGNTQSSNEPATGGQVQSTPTTCKLFIIAFERNTYEVTINNPEVRQHNSYKLASYHNNNYADHHSRRVEGAN